jgi:hypothetical protein
MSDAGRKMDVEDVLSSIRRLVSEEARSAPEKHAPQSPTPPPASVEAETAMPAREKLVLTPAFRIPEGPVVDQTHQDSPVPQETPEPNVQEINAAAEIPPAQPAPLTPVETAPPPQESTPKAPLADNIETFPPEAEEIQATPLDLSSIIPSLQELQDQARKNMLDLEPVPELAETANSAPLAETADTPASEASLDPVETTPDSPAEPPLTAKSEPAAKDIAEPVAQQEPVPEHPAHSREYDAIDYTAEKETYLDEEALRELVSEMVRSELQGELGDRITRNVRKLVRREIHRALASREFD